MGAGDDNWQYSADDNWQNKSEGWQQRNSRRDAAKSAEGGWAWKEIQKVSKASSKGESQGKGWKGWRDQVSGNDPSDKQDIVKPSNNQRAPLENSQGRWQPKRE